MSRCQYPDTDVAMDTTQKRVHHILSSAAEHARPRRNRVTAQDILDICGCSHQVGSHHGPDGMGRCGEAGCGCLGWHPAKVECPDCGVLWVEEGHACPGCGLTVEEIAERLSRQ